MSTQKRWYIVLASISATSLFLLHIANLLEERQVSALPSGFIEFKISDPPPRCDSWKAHMPKLRDPVAYQIYLEARKLWRSKIGWRHTRDDLNRVLRGVRDASDKGDWGARALMARFYLYGLGVLDSNRVLDADPGKAMEIVRVAADAGQPWAIYDLGLAYQHGYGGISQSDTLAWAYFLKAAKLGSPEAQMALADAYGEARQLENQEAMRNCAYTQRHGPAAAALGVNRRAVKEDFIAAIKYFHDGVAFGDKDSADALERLYEKGYWPHMGEDERPKFESLGIVVDLERSRRYRIISEALEVNPDLRLIRLDMVLPPPPAKLPPWSSIEDALAVESDRPPAY